MLSILRPTSSWLYPQQYSISSLLFHPPFFSTIGHHGAVRKTFPASHTRVILAGEWYEGFGNPKTSATWCEGTCFEALARSGCFRWLGSMWIVLHVISFDSSFFTVNFRYLLFIIFERNIANVAASCFPHTSQPRMSVAGQKNAYICRIIFHFERYLPLREQMWVHRVEAAQPCGTMYTESCQEAQPQNEQAISGTDRGWKTCLLF